MQLKLDAWFRGIRNFELCSHVLNDEKVCCETGEDKIAICEITAGQQSGNFSKLSVLYNVSSRKRYFSSKTCEMKIVNFRHKGFRYLICK